MFLPSKARLAPWVNACFNSVALNYCPDFQCLRFPDSRLTSRFYISPQKITTMCRVKKDVINNPFLFSAGDWSPLMSDIGQYRKSNIRYVSCDAVLHNGNSILSTIEFESLVVRLEKDGHARGLKSRSCVERYLLDIEKMYYSIAKSRRLCSQEELGLPKFGNEVSFSIDEKMNLVKVDGGHHRFAAALSLELKIIPVQVRKIHLSCVPFIKENFPAGVAGINAFIESVVSRYR